MTWAIHNVRFRAPAVKLFNHRIVGELRLSFNRLDIAADPGPTLFAYTAVPNSRCEEALNQLGSWAGTVDAVEAQQTSAPS